MGWVDISVNEKRYIEKLEIYAESMGMGDHFRVARGGQKTFLGWWFGM